MFSFKGELEQSGPGKGAHTWVLSLAWEGQLSQWGPGDRLTRGEFLCLGLGLKSLLFVTPDLQKSKKNFQLSLGGKQPPWLWQGLFLSLNFSISTPGLLTPSNIQARGPALESNDPLPSRNTRSERTSTVWFCLCEVPSVAESTETESRLSGC